jgi:starch-binding outer membrane protein, SusD/RagB family
MKTNFFRVVITFVGLFALNACTLESVPDPNFLGTASIGNDDTKLELNSLVYGQFSLARNGLPIYLQVTGTLGKELFNFNATESRWMTELNGLRAIDNSAFYNGATTSFGLPIRQANILLAAAEKTTQATTAEKNGYKGLANTFKGLAYLYMLNVQYQNGVRLNVEDPFKPSKPATYAASLAGIAGFLDEGATQLDAASFAFSMPTGFTSFNTPTLFKQFNRAIALRVAIYQKDWAKAALLLPQTFYNETGDLMSGPLHTFNPSSPDIANTLLNTSSVTIVGLDEVFDVIEPNDKRLGKVTTVGGPFSYTSGTNVSAKYKSIVYTSASQPVPIIRNEELILIAAEIAAQQTVPNLVEAKRLVDIVRAANGILPVATFATKDEAINAILKERLYSLWYEGHRWIDMRRYDKLSQIALPPTTPVMKVLVQLERPVQEVNWDAQNP